MHEPYRTLLGPLPPRDRPLLLGPADQGLRPTRRVPPSSSATSGQDYGQALQRHYAEGAPADWPSSFVSAYASCHPWEDWAETWAHYLHMTDTLETAVACGLSLRPEAAGRAGAEARHRRRRRAAAVVRPDHRALVPADLRAEQPQPRHGPARRLPVRPLDPGHREAPVRPRGRQRRDDPQVSRPTRLEQSAFVGSALRTVSSVHTRDTVRKVLRRVGQPTKSAQPPLVGSRRDDADPPYQSVSFNHTGTRQSPIGGVRFPIRIPVQHRGIGPQGGPYRRLGPAP